MKVIHYKVQGKQLVRREEKCHYTDRSCYYKHRKKILPTLGGKVIKPETKVKNY